MFGYKDMGRVYPVTVGFRWRIRDFRELFAQIKPGELMTSPTFIVEQRSPVCWRLLLRPKNSSIELVDQVTLLAEPLLEVRSTGAETRRLQLNIIDRTGELVKTYTEVNLGILVSRHRYGKSAYCSITELLARDSSLLQPDGSLLIACQIEVDSDPVITQPSLDPANRAQLGAQLLTGQYSDCRLVCRGQEFPGHRNILATSSFCLAKMIWNCPENGICILKMDELRPEVLQEMMRYIYTGTINRLDELAEELMWAADQFQVKGLKTLCEDGLIQKLTVSNARRYYELALKVKARELEARARQLNPRVESSSSEEEEEETQPEGENAEAGNEATVDVEDDENEDEEEEDLSSYTYGRINEEAFYADNYDDEIDSYEEESDDD